MEPIRPFLLACLLIATPASANANDQIADLSLEQLLAVSINGASKYEQKQSEVAAAVSVISRNEIKTFGWRSLDEALASLPGIYTTYDRQYSYLGARGFNVPGDYNTRMLVLVNGNRVNDPVYDAGQSGRAFPLDIELIERIEYIPGPGGAVYGQNAMFGVVNVITRRGAAIDGAELSAAYQHPQAQREGRASWGKLFDNGVDLMVSVSGLRARGDDLFFTYPGAPLAAGLASGLDGARGRQLFARVGAGPWSFDHLYGDFHKNDPTGAYLSDPLQPGQYQEDAYTLSQLQYQDWLAGDALQVSGRLFAGRQRYRSHLRYGGVFSFPASSDWYGGELRLLSGALAGHKLMLGLEAQENSRVEQSVLDLSDPANALVIASPGHRFGVYAQDEWRLAETLSSTLGLRVDRNNRTGTTLSPRVALIWQAAAPTTVKALYGRAHRAPNAYERDFGDGLAQAPNPALSGETIDTLELVGDHRVNHDLTLHGSVYRWTVRGLVTLGLDPLSGLPQYHNGADVRSNGLELAADQTWGFGARLRASATCQHAYEAGGATPANSPRLTGKLNFSSPLRPGGARAGGELQYYGARRTLDGASVAGYWLANLNLSADKWAGAAGLSLGIYNLFNRRYEHPAADNNWQRAFAQDGRSARIKLDYRF